MTTSFWICATQLGDAPSSLSQSFLKCLGMGAAIPVFFFLFKSIFFSGMWELYITVYILAIYLNCQRWHFCILLGLC
uniref:Uncharacterized protein n=1 Tax=Populus trichocarpa TaxID=3694 RepID=A0A3N7FQD9_POPTR